jgi:hypothetical protein
VEHSLGQSVTQFRTQQMSKNISMIFPSYTRPKVEGAPN